MVCASFVLLLQWLIGRKSCMMYIQEEKTKSKPSAWYKSGRTAWRYVHTVKPGFEPQHSKTVSMIFHMKCHSSMHALSVRGRLNWMSHLLVLRLMDFKDPMLYFSKRKRHIIKNPGKVPNSCFKLQGALRQRPSRAP